MKTTTARHDGKAVVILYVNREVTWVIATYDLQDKNKQFKIDVIELENPCMNDLQEMSQQERRGI